MFSSIPQPPSPLDGRSRSSSIAESGFSKQSRTSRACEGCRKRKVKCSGGAVCETCAKFNEPCSYRKHYRALKGYPIKIVKNPSEKTSKRRKSSTASQSSVDIGFEKRSSLSSMASYSLGDTSPIELASNSSIPVFNQIIFTPPLLSNGKTYSDATVSPRPADTTMSKPPTLVPVPIEYPNKSFLQSLPGYKNSVSTEFSALNLIRNLSPTVYVHSCSCFVSRKRNSSIFASPITISPQLPPLTQSAMLTNLNQYFSLYHPTIPMLNPRVWKNKAFIAWNTIDKGSLLSFNQIELAIIYLLVALGSNNKETAFNYFEKAQKIIPNVFDVPVCLNIIQYTLLLSVFEAVVNKNLHESSKLATLASESSNSLGLHSLLDVAKYGSLDIPGLNQTESYRTWVCAYVWQLELNLAASNTDENKIKNMTTIIDRPFTEIEFDPSVLKLRVSALEMDARNGCAGLASTIKKGGLESLQLGVNHYISAIGFPTALNQLTQISQDAVLMLSKLVLSSAGRQSPFAYLYKHILNKCAIALLYFYCVEGQSSVVLSRLKRVLGDAVEYLSTCAHCGKQSEPARIGIPAAGSINEVRFFRELETALQSDVSSGFAELNINDTASTFVFGGSTNYSSNPYGSVSPRSESPGSIRTPNSNSFMEPKIDVIENDKNSQVLKIVI